MFGTPSSIAVGMSGAALSRSGPLIARMRILPAPVQFEHLPGDVRRHHRDVTADEIGDARAGTAIGNVDHIGQPGELLE